MMIIDSHVHIFKKISGYIIDTSNIVVVYCTCLAMWDALNFKPENQVLFDRSTKQFCFKK